MTLEWSVEKVILLLTWAKLVRITEGVLVWTGSQIDLHRTDKKIPGEILLLGLNEQDIQHGLSAGKWTQLINAIDQKCRKGRGN